jgi:potassium/chloride transporter 8
MGGELQNPYKNIAKGELSAIGISTIGCILFIITFGASVQRDMLLCDTLVGEKVSITKLLFLSGIYIASLSSLTAGLIGTPRVAAAIASEGFIPLLNPLAIGDETTNNNPIRATLVLTTISIVFVLLGDLNYLAILSTLPFLFTYATVNYAYVSLAMSTDLKELKSQIAGQDSQQPKTITTDYGSSHNLARDNLNALFPERQESQLDSNFTNMGAGNYFYSPFTNRYVALCGAVINILICFLINFWMSIVHVIAIALLYYHIGQRCPTINTGVSEFSVRHMFQVVAKGDVPVQQTGKDTLLIGGTATGPNFNIDASRLNDDNEDYAHRKQYHHSENY